MRLLIDLGNTRAKWRLDRQDGVISAGAHAHSDPDFGDAIRSAWRLLPCPDEIVLASVGPASARDVLRAVARKVFGGAPLIEVQTARCCGDVRIAYAEPKRLGVDRFLALVAAHRRAPRDQLVVGIGTALTIDALGADGRHHGGLIAPSPALMQRSLIGATACIRPAAPGAVLDLAADTADAIASGAWQAAAGLVERIFARADRWGPARPAVVLHGGDAATLAGLLGFAVEVTPELVLDGLAFWAEGREGHVPHGAEGPPDATR
jgi:type III pantothenate kinase